MLLSRANESEVQLKLELRKRNLTKSSKNITRRKKEIRSSIRATVSHTPEEALAIQWWKND
jgi:hypothetical protein